MKELLKRCSAATNTREAWVAIGIVFLVLGFMGHATAYYAIGAAFLAIGVARGRARRSTE